MPHTPSQKLTALTKIAYGMGLSAEGITSNAFNVFLLFYYQQVLGLPGAWTGIALMLALGFDAITDPVVGAWSDRTASRLGRRHPFMYASVIPLPVCFYLVWAPPQGLSTGLLFGWLLFFAIATRFASTLFLIPHQSLVAELSQDPHERTGLQSVRTAFSWLFGLMSAVLGYAVFMRSTPEYTNGLENPAGYPAFALFGAVVMLFSVCLSALGTQRAVRRSAAVKAVGMRHLIAGLRTAMGSRSYRAATLGGLLLYVGFGINENLSPYINTYFWGFTTEQISFFILLIAIATLCVMAVARPLGARWGKRNVAIGCAVGSMIFTPVPVVLRLGGMLPESGSANLLWALSGPIFCSYSSLIMGMVMVGSMIADVTDEHELRTGLRQEGLLFAASAFIIKSASGLGTFGAGLAVSAAGVDVGSATEGIDTLAVIHAGGFLVLGSCMIAFFRRYELDGARHVEIRSELERRRGVERDSKPGA